jgi:hypothetical protein
VPDAWIDTGKRDPKDGRWVAGYGDQSSVLLPLHPAAALEEIEAIRGTSRTSADAG